MLTVVTTANNDFDMVVPKQVLNTRVPLSQPPIYAERSFTGQGQERGGVQTLLSNPSPDQAVEFVYLESLPWFMRTYLHTLSAKVVNDDDGGGPSNAKTNDKIIRKLHYRPALDRHRPTHLEILLSVPANSTVVLTYDFEKAILRYTEYPPDANRGFDIPPAIIRLISPLSNNNNNNNNNNSQADAEHGIYTRTTLLLLSLPTPDFSMPYNVIILTSTVMALAFGGIFNIIVRRFVGADEVDGGAVATSLVGGGGSGAELVKRVLRVCRLVVGKIGQVVREQRGDKGRLKVE